MTKNLKVKFLFDSDKGIKDLHNLKKETKSFHKDVKPKSKGGVINDLMNGAGGKNQIPTMGGMLGGLKSKIMSLHPAFMVAAAGAAALAVGIGKIISAGMDAEDSISKMTVMYKGDAIRAIEDYNKALVKSTETRFDPKQVIAGMETITAYGGNAFKKNMYGVESDLITLVADMASYSKQTMEQAGTALMRGDLALLDRYGQHGRDAYAKAKKAGRLGSKEFIAEFAKEMSSAGTLWYGMAEKASKDASGLVSTIVGNAGLIWTYLSGAAEGKDALTFWNSFKSILTSISDGFGELVKWLKPMLIDIGAALGGVFEAIWTVVKFIWMFVKPILNMILGPLFLGLRAVLKVIIWISNAVT